MYFGTKSYSKSNRNHTVKHTLSEHLETRLYPRFQKKLIFLYVLDRFDTLILKIIFKK
jgi:hypothetical protein